jgi:hypothetical protein
MRIFLILIFAISFYSALCADTTKVAFAVRTASPPKIDGILDEIWNSAKPITDFAQFTPHYNVATTQKTDVRILYDDNAIYVFANLFDTSPDSILKQLGNRDDDNLNADYFGIEFDTYNNQLDAYSFMVYSSGVQADSREFDDTYNAVWESKTKITENGWTAEYKIPYSALRFPTTDIQTWGMEIYRNIRRIREMDYWALLIKGSQNDLVYWGKLKGLENIKAPIRLSFNPYISGGLENYKYDKWNNSENSWSFAGGLDLKYGINESFTLDMTLMPDFSQVQSDNKVKNLSAFETVYNEQRPFFNEAIDLFSKGNLFYSRRIGRTPHGFYDVENVLDSGETIKTNPTQSQLLNATKVSGRNRKGLAIGFFNAIVNDTWATIKKTDGSTRRILTEPLANYNILVFDQALKNNSSIFLSNSNYTRDKDFHNSNVTVGGFNLVDKTNSWSINGSGGISQRYYRGSIPAGIEKPIPGFKYALSAGKVNGKFKFALNNSIVNNHYNANDVGLTLYNNFINNNINVSYNIYEPFWILRELSNNFSINNSINYSTKDISGFELNYNFWCTLKNYLSIWGQYGATIYEGYDYYEPRVEGRFFRKKKTNGFSLGFSSDYRKTFALDGNIGYYNTPAFNDKFKELTLSPILRVSNHFLFKYSFSIYNQSNEKGFATLSQDTIIFGNRDVTTITNSFEGKYIVINDLSISLRARHYWSKGVYDQYFQLLNDGSLSELNTDFAQNFNYNSFNIDFVVSWQFAPGSNLSFVWKKEILNESDVIINNFNKNFSNTFEQPQWNTFSIKAIYYLDYQYLKKKSK